MSKIVQSPGSNDASRQQGNRWAIVLAGGKGERMRSFIRRSLNCDWPKQFCAFEGSRSMIQHAIDLAGGVAAPSRIVAVIGAGQENYYNSAVDDPQIGSVIEQPADRGTATAVMVALESIYRQDPLATVAILPADQHVDPDRQFIRCVSQMCAIAEADRDRLAILGIPASAPETDFGWIVPATPLNPARHGSENENGARIAEFHEKPDSKHAYAFYRRGCLWNSMVCAGKIAAWRELFERFLPDTSKAFRHFREALASVGAEGGRSAIAERMEHFALKGLYAETPPADFAADFLQQAAGHFSVVVASGLEWNDWGRPERVMESLRRKQVAGIEAVGIAPASIEAVLPAGANSLAI